MLSSFDAGQSEVSLCTIWLGLNKNKEMEEEEGLLDPPPPTNLFNTQKSQSLDG